MAHRTTPLSIDPDFMHTHDSPTVLHGFMFLVCIVGLILLLPIKNSFFFPDLGKESWTLQALFVLIFL